MAATVWSCAKNLEDKATALEMVRLLGPDVQAYWYYSQELECNSRSGYQLRKNVWAQAVSNASHLQSGSMHARHFNQFTRWQLFGFQGKIGFGKSAKSSTSTSQPTISRSCKIELFASARGSGVSRMKSERIAPAAASSNGVEPAPSELP